MSDDLQFYRVEECIRSDADCQCAACKQWTIVYDDGEPIEIGTSWQGSEGKELAEDICELMNMAYDAGVESERALENEVKAALR